MKENASPVVFPAGEHTVRIRGGTVVFRIPANDHLSDVASGFAAMARERRGNEPEREAPASA